MSINEYYSSTDQIAHHLLYIAMHSASVSFGNL